MIAVCCAVLWTSGVMGEMTTNRTSLAQVEVLPMPALPLPVEGAFMGMLNGELIVAGGVRTIPSKGDLEMAEYLDTVYALAFDRNGVPGRWRDTGVRLPVAAAFGAAVESGGELVLVGGMTRDGITDAVQRVTLKAGKYEAGMATQSPLPKPLAFAGAVRMSRDFNRVYGDTVLMVMGGISPSSGNRGWEVNETPYIWVLSVNPAGCHKLLKPFQRLFMHFWDQPEKPTQWRVLTESYGNYFPAQPTAADCPVGLVNPQLLVRKDFRTEKSSLFVVGGLRQQSDGSLTPSETVSQYVPGDKSLDGWRQYPGLDRYVPLSVVSLGAAHVAAWGDYVEGVIKTPLDLARLEARKIKLFHSVTATWVDLEEIASLPAGGRVVPLPASPMITYPHGRFAWLGSEPVTGQGEDGKLVTVRVGTGADAHIHFAQRLFTGWDVLVIVVYILAMLYVGNYFSKREKNTEDFFLGGRKIPWWAAGISIYATGISAISFMAIPAKTFATNWDRICLGLFPPVTTYIAAMLFIPMLRSLQITTLMEYFEKRFDKSIRFVSSFLGIIGQIGGRMAVTLLLPSIALSAVTGMDLKLSIILMGVVATVYTVMGGISAVIWTDVAQTVVIFGGALLALVVICLHVDGGLMGVFRAGMEPGFDKFTMFNWSFDLSVATVWVFTIWAIGDLFARLGQESLQRAFATPDERSAKLSMITCAVISIPGTLLFYLLGSALFAYYRTHAVELDPAMEENAVLPFFVVQQLPPGVSGLIIAGLFAAAMSTLDSAMNTVATIITRDYYSVFRQQAGEEERLRVARWITCVTGLLGTLMALYFGMGRGLGNLWDHFSKIMALIGGGFGGVIVLGMLTRKTSTTSLYLGIMTGTIMTVMMEVKAFNYAFIFFVYGTLSTAICVVVGWLTSFLFPNRKDLTGLTVWTTQKEK